ncbi:NAD-dependent epimerase/dehydratase family protein [Salinactinospora qingdaonensis]|uniref:NAD(P)-dependent oxidoreductase n=1 Tax=Salinactinospora qingdaonensis TaxID=702744 RepID=A0ABP7FIX2_9ACTN
MDANLGRIVMTGAAGSMGSTLRAGLREDADELVLFDNESLTAESDNETVITGDVADLDAVDKALHGADAVVHLAARSAEAPLAELLEANVNTTFTVLEAARRAGVRRVVLGSSNRVTGHYPIHHHVFPDEPPRPDGFYGVSKVAVEALGQLYADKFGLEVVALRFGSFATEPSQTRHLATWLSPRDCVGFVRAALTAETVTFTVVYAVSANARRFWDLTAGESELGYRPVDDASRFAHNFPDDDPFWHGGPQAGDLADVEAILPHLPK